MSHPFSAREPFTLGEPERTGAPANTFTYACMVWSSNRGYTLFSGIVNAVSADALYDEKMEQIRLTFAECHGYLRHQVSVTEYNTDDMAALGYHIK